ncbi:hypothetical protein D1Y75_00875 [Riemerella anatipestifer]|uniref:Uncharacterized protein n=2 Tax=Riemerella anatipestifer TaxID=34085 RepID=J9QTG2_RIEAN|nr:hypothetical protein B739_1268 [Riemerella anatipestifer RA-CH-1]MSN87458.1 hypothetical protein [Riemerella anatipestifer]MSN91620.1 hypothetical protein [Riemerella anatipestifer]MSN94168.1 hypothetical protein [Riemerella anatipestifer]OBP63734.1 hypothetical protein AWB84_03690 [Riemerella anatipestifer]
MKNNMTKQEVIELVTHLQEWHKNIVEQLKLIKDADDSITIQIESDGKTVPIRGKLKLAFKVGIITALNMIEEFPIEITEE